jgi:hypothetical protein
MHIWCIKPVIRLDTTKGKTSILSIRMSKSPGNEINMIVSLLRLAGLSKNPNETPKITPRKVMTSKKCFFKCPKPFQYKYGMHIYIYSIGITYVTHALDPPFSRILTQPHAILKVPHTYSHEVPGRKNTKTGESVRKCEVLF